MFTLTLLLVLVWFALIALGMPIFLSLGFISITGIYLSGMSLAAVIDKMYSSLDSFSLIAVPMFILGGELMNEAGLTRRLVILSKSMLGHFSGGLAYTNVTANVIMSGISGSALAEAAGVGKVMIPAMIKEGYQPKFVANLTATASVLGPLIPPSIPLVIYAVVVGESVGKMLIAGTIPGLLVAGLLLLYSHHHVTRVERRQSTSQFRVSNLLRGFKIGFLSLISVVIIVFGIVFGVFTPTEGAAVAVLYILVISTSIYRSLTLNSFFKACKTSALISSSVLVTLASAGLFSYFLTFQGIPQAITAVMLDAFGSPVSLLLAISALIIFLGCFLDGLAIMLMIVPIIYPAVLAFGIDPIHFGVVVTLGLMTGLITPPFGPSLFLISQISSIPYGSLAMSILPWLGCLVLSIVICILFPALSVWLPSLMVQ